MNAAQHTGTPVVMTIRELADALSIGRQTAYEMTKGPLAHLVVRVGEGGTGIRIKRDGFWAWLESQGSGKEGR